MSSDSTSLKQMPLISIIVPVYNVKFYLEECVESLVKQSYHSIEIILVDDGSTDGSSELCDCLADSYPLVSVVHKANGGQADARNVGLSIAKGEWIAFVDSDDFVSPVFIEALYIAAVDSGTLMSTLRHGISFIDGHAPHLIQNIKLAKAYHIETDEEYQRELLYQKSWNGSVWRLCHRSLFDNVSFPVNLLYEDAATTYRLVHEIDELAVLETTGLYAYRQNEGGTMRGAFRIAKLDSCLIVTRTMMEEIVNWYPDLSKSVCSRCFAICRVVFSQVPADDIRSQLLLWDETQKYAKTVISDPDARKREKLAALISRMGRLPFRVFCNTYRFLLHAQ